MPKNNPGCPCCTSLSIVNGVWCVKWDCKKESESDAAPYYGDLTLYFPAQKMTLIYYGYVDDDGNFVLVDDKIETLSIDNELDLKFWPPVVNDPDYNGPSYTGYPMFPSNILNYTHNGKQIVDTEFLTSEFLKEDRDDHFILDREKIDGVLKENGIEDGLGNWPPFFIHIPSHKFREGYYKIEYDLGDLGTAYQIYDPYTLANYTNSDGTIILTDYRVLSPDSFPEHDLTIENVDNSTLFKLTGKYQHKTLKGLCCPPCVVKWDVPIPIHIDITGSGVDQPYYNARGYCADAWWSSYCKCPDDPAHCFSYFNEDKECVKTNESPYTPIGYSEIETIDMQLSQTYSGILDPEISFGSFRQKIWTDKRKLYTVREKYVVDAKCQSGSYYSNLEYERDVYGIARVQCTGLPGIRCGEAPMSGASDNSLFGDKCCTSSGNVIGPTTSFEPVSDCLPYSYDLIWPSPCRTTYIQKNNGDTTYEYRDGKWITKLEEYDIMTLYGFLDPYYTTHYYDAPCGDRDINDYFLEEWCSYLEMGPCDVPCGMAGCQFLYLDMPGYTTKVIDPACSQFNGKLIDADTSIGVIYDTKANNGEIGENNPPCLIHFGGNVA